MVDCNAEELMRQLADEYELRYLEGSREYVGFYEGMILQARRDGATIAIYAASPAAELGEQILNDFEGFSSLQQAGVPAKWLRGNMLTPSEVDPHGCVLELGPARLKSISTDQFLAIPNRLATDFRNLGPDDFSLVCQSCEAENPRQVALVGPIYQILCDRCFSDLKAAAPTGRLENRVPVDWTAASATLLIGSLIFAVIWGWLQQPSLGIDDGRLLLLAPFFGSMFLVNQVAKRAHGRSLGLRLATVAAIIFATLSGNIWGFRSHALAQGIPLSWSDAARFYFQVQLPQNSEVEILYLVGGAAGAWFGLSILKAAGFTRIE